MSITLMFKKTIPFFPSTIIILAVLLLPLGVFAMVMVPKGSVPNPPPLQPSSPLIKPNISQNINTPPKPVPYGWVATSTPSSSLQSAAQQPPAPPPLGTAAQELSPDTTALWARPWLWALVLVLGCCLGYWLIMKDRSKS